jgi:hypothetical protein
VPSISEVVLTTDGSIRFEGYKSSEGRSAIEDVLNNPELMASILERAKEIEPGSGVVPSNYETALFIVQVP